MQKSKIHNQNNNIEKKNAWYHAIVLASVSMFILFVVYWQTFYGMVGIWMRSDTFTHGFIIFPIVTYLLWKNRSASMSVYPQISMLGILTLFIITNFWIAGYLTNIALLQHLSFIAMIPAILWSLLGNQFIRKNAFPLAYLFFAVPMGEFLVPVLQDITASITVYLLRLSNIPVVLEGRYFYIPSGSFEVAKACSGIRYLIATLAIGSLYAYLIYRNIWRRLFFMALTVIVPIIANGIRAYGIVLLANYSDYKYAVGFDHIIYGWLFFGVVIFLLFWLGSLFQDVSQSTINNQETIISTENKGNYLYASLVFLILFIAPLTLAWLDKRSNSQIYESFTIPKLTQKGWSGPHESVDVWRPHFNGATREYRVAYSKSGKKVEVYLAYYQKQKQGSEMISSINRFYDAKQFRRKNELPGKLKLNNNLYMSIKSTELTSKMSARIMYNWYLIGRTTTTNTLFAKLLEVESKFSQQKNAAIAVAITSEISGSLAESTQFLDHFVAEFQPRVLEELALKNKSVVKEMPDRGISE